MKRPLLMICLCLVLAALVRTRGSGPPGTLEAFLEASRPRAGQPITVTGRIYQKEDQSIYLKNASILISAAGQRQEIPLTENIICDWEKKELLPLGSVVLLSGKIEPFYAASNPGEFDRKSYYKTLGIGGRLSEGRLLAKGESHWIVPEAMYRLRQRWKERLYSIMPPREASVMSTMLLGDTAGLDGEIKELYKRNGIVHILSISGLHITMIGMTLYRLLRRLGMPIWLAALAGSVVLILYGVMTGLGVSALRAIAMYLLRMLGEAWGRTYDMLTALGVAGAVTLLFNPMYLYHAGFLLSYGAVLGMGVLKPALFGGERKQKIERYEPKKAGSVLKRKLCRRAQSVLEAAQASVSVTAATLPVLLWFYYEVPVYSVFLNLLILPLMEPIMLAGILGMVLPGMGLSGKICVLLLKTYEILCGIFDGLPFHTWNPGRPGLWQIAVYYLLLCGAAAAGKGRLRGILHFSGRECFQRKGRFCEKAGKGLCICAGLLALSLSGLPKDQVTFLDVGQGDCICIQTAAGQNYLFDCGSSSRNGVGTYVLAPFLKQQGISHVDAVFVSHPDSDHTNGIVEILKEGQITFGELVLPDIEEAKKEEAFADIFAAAERCVKNPPGIRYIKAGDSFTSGKMTALCLHPPKGFSGEDANVYSQCFYVKWGDGPLSLLLTGDTEKEGEQLLLEQLKMRDIEKVTILKAAHHGSKNATREELLDLLSPQLAVISCGRENRYGHPHKEVLKRLEEAGVPSLQTPHTGAVTVTCKGGKILIRSQNR